MPRGRWEIKSARFLWKNRVSVCNFETFPRAVSYGGGVRAITRKKKAFYTRVYIPTPRTRYITHLIFTNLNISLSRELHHFRREKEVFLFFF